GGGPPSRPPPRPAPPPPPRGGPAARPLIPFWPAVGAPTWGPPPPASLAAVAVPARDCAGQVAWLLPPLLLAAAWMLFRQRAGQARRTRRALIHLTVSYAGLTGLAAAIAGMPAPRTGHMTAVRHGGGLAGWLTTGLAGHLGGSPAAFALSAALALGGPAWWVFRTVRRASKARPANGRSKTGIGAAGPDPGDIGVPA